MRRLAHQFLSQHRRIAFKYADHPDLNVVFESAGKAVQVRKAEIRRQIEPSKSLEDIRKRVEKQTGGEFEIFWDDYVDECSEYRARYDLAFGDGGLKDLRKKYRKAIDKFDNFVSGLSDAVGSKAPHGVNLFAPTTWQEACRHFLAWQASAHIADDIPSFEDHALLRHYGGNTGPRTARQNTLDGSLSATRASLVAAEKMVSSNLPEGHHKEFWKDHHVEQALVYWLDATCHERVDFEKFMPSGWNYGRTFLIEMIRSVWGEKSLAVTTAEKRLSTAMKAIRERLEDIRSSRLEATISYQVASEFSEGDCRNLAICFELGQQISQRWNQELPDFARPRGYDADAQILAEYGQDHWPMWLDHRSKS
ncbi:hypothetical protein [Hyphobacterium indicum]|uniref:hypothetical protein n=1 Tax=Hyphobacterium indicum TaxID=2162714 RepID=UPI000F62DDCB|nr:hypothetical protein [Hyphobacterium indicum]